MTSPYWNRGSTWGNALGGSSVSIAPVAAVGVVAVVRLLAVNLVARMGATLLRDSSMCDTRPVNENDRHRLGIPVAMLFFLVLFLVNKKLVCE